MMKSRMIFISALLIAILVSACSMFEIAPDSAKTESTKGTEISQENKDISGTIKIAYAWGQRFTPPQQFSRAVVNLKNAIIKWTDIEAELTDHLRLDSSKIMDMPLVYLAADKAFELTAQEKSNVANYLKSGGFLILDNATANWEESQAEASLRKMMKDVLGSGARFQPLPNNHEIYHCYFQFDDGPPIGSENKMVKTNVITGEGGDNEIRRMPQSVRFLEGIYVGGRLAVILSNKGYVVNWNEYSGNAPQLKIGVNFAVFALTQTGSIGEKSVTR